MADLKTPFRYDYVGSFLRPEALKQARKNFEEGNRVYFFTKKGMIKKTSLKEYDGDDKLKTKINIFLENVKRWQSQEKYMALDELIWQIYLDTGYYHFVSLMPNGNVRQANLKILFDY